MRPFLELSCFCVGLRGGIWARSAADRFVCLDRSCFGCYVRLLRRLAGLLGENAGETLKLCLHSVLHSVARATVAKMTCYINLLTQRMSACVFARACSHNRNAVSPLMQIVNPSWVRRHSFQALPLSHRDIYRGSSHQYTPPLPP